MGRDYRAEHILTFGDRRLSHRSWPWWALQQGGGEQRFQVSLLLAAALVTETEGGSDRGGEKTTWSTPAQSKKVINIIVSENCTNQCLFSEDASLKQKKLVATVLGRLLLKRMLARVERYEWVIYERYAIAWPANRRLLLQALHLTFITASPITPQVGKRN